jgi:hypothetical protein
MEVVQLDLCDVSWEIRRQAYPAAARDMIWPV